MKIDKVIVHHVGARDHYFAALFFLKQKVLFKFFTDYWLRKNVIYQFLLKKIASRRFENSLNDFGVTNYNLMKITFSIIKKRKSKDKFDAWIAHGFSFCQFVLNKLTKIIKENENYLIWGYTCVNYEILKHYQNKKNIVLVHNQIDPGKEYYDIQQELFRKYKNIEEKPLYPSKEFIGRIDAECKLADIIIVNSEYSKKCLIKNNIIPSKINVLPLIYAKKIEKVDKRYRKKLNIGFVGNINLIKGFYLFFETAKMEFKSHNFIAAGTSKLANDFISEAKEFIDFRGHLSKNEMEDLYKELDILIFPSYCDGFGMVQLEAMARGIPVIASKNCGDVVQDSKNGFLVHQESKEILEKIKKLNQNRELLKEFSKNAQNRVLDFLECNYKNNLNRILRKNDIELF